MCDAQRIVCGLMGAVRAAAKHVWRNAGAAAGAAREAQAAQAPRVRLKPAKAPARAGPVAQASVRVGIKRHSQLRPPAPFAIPLCIVPHPTSMCTAPSRSNHAQPSPAQAAPHASLMPPHPQLTSTSPGTTGLRQRQLSTPPKKKLFCCAASVGSIITMPPSCARASTCSTPADRR